jgi:hypothetical protein
MSDSVSQSIGRALGERVKAMCLWLIVPLLVCAAVSCGQEQDSRSSSGDELERLRTVIDDVFRLTKPHQLPRRIELLDSLLVGIAKEDDPKLWATLHGEPVSEPFR